MISMTKEVRGRGWVKLGLYLMWGVDGFPTVATLAMCLESYTITPWHSSTNPAWVYGRKEGQNLIIAPIYFWQFMTFQSHDLMGFVDPVMYPSSAENSQVLWSNDVWDAVTDYCVLLHYGPVNQHCSNGEEVLWDAERLAWRKTPSNVWVWVIVKLFVTLDTFFQATPALNN